PAYKIDMTQTELVAESMKVKIGRFEARTAEDFERVSAAMAKARMDAVLVHQEGMLNANPKRIADLARKHKILSAGLGASGDSGGLIGYGVNFPQMYRRAAGFVD